MVWGPVRRSRGRCRDLGKPWEVFVLFVGGPGAVLGQHWVILAPAGAARKPSAGQPDGISSLPAWESNSTHIAYFVCCVWPLRGRLEGSLGTSERPAGDLGAFLVAFRRWGKSWRPSLCCCEATRGRSRWSSHRRTRPQAEGQTKV